MELQADGWKFNLHVSPFPLERKKPSPVAQEILRERGSKAGGRASWALSVSEQSEMANPISTAIKTGTVGELLVQLRLLQYDVQAAPPIKDSGNDLVALRGFVVRTIQVKTTTDGVPGWPPEARLYHLLAVVRLEGEDTELSLDKSRVFGPEARPAGIGAYLGGACGLFAFSAPHVSRLFPE